MNRGKLNDRRHWRKVRQSGGVAEFWRRHSRCYLVALVREDGTLRGVSTFSDLSPTSMDRTVPVVVDEWEAAGYYGNAERRAFRAMRHGAHAWAWPWVNPSRAAHEVRPELYDRAKRGEIRPPADVAEKAAEMWRQHNEAMAEYRRRMAEDGT